MAIDVDQLIADAQAARAKAAEDQAKADAAAKAIKESDKANAKYKIRAQQKLDYANALQKTITDYEGRLRIFAEQIARDGKLNPVDQKEFDRIVTDYQKVSKTYNKTINETNAILSKAPSPVQVTTTPTGTAEVGKTKEQKAAEDLKAGAQPGATDTKSLVNKTNADLDDKIKKAKDFFYNAAPGVRAQWATILKNAGYKVPQTDTYNVALVTAYQSLINEAKLYNTTNQEITSFSPYDLNGYLVYKTNILKDTGAGAAGGPKSMAYVSSPTDAAGIINGVVYRELGRDATSLELDVLTKALNAYERANPYITGDTTRTGGVGQVEYIRQLVTGMTSLKDKAGKKIVDTLAKEFTTKKADKTQLALDTVKATALANGFDLDQTTLDSYANRIKNGESPDTIKKSIRDIMAAHYEKNKGVADLLRAGTDLAEIALPYKNTMAQILEIPADQISLNDSLLSSAIGTEGNMPMYEFKKALRKDPRWQYTNNAKEEVSNAVTSILKDFGFRG